MTKVLKKVSLLSHHPINETIYLLSDIEDLKDNISRLGLLQPLIIDKKNRIISGNRRFISIKELGWKEVEVEIIDFKEEEIPLYIVSFNKYRNKTIREQLSEIKILEKYYSKGKGFRSDLTSANIGKGSTRNVISEKTGVSSGQIQKILFIDKHKNELIDFIDKGFLTINQAYIECTRINKEEEILSFSESKKNIIERNNVFELYNKSSKKMKEIEDEKIQMIFTSPPYWKKRKYTNNPKELGSEINSNDYVNKLVKHLDDCYRVLKNDGSFFLNLGDTFLNGNLQNIPHKVSIKLQSKGWILRNTIIWKKTNPKPTSSKSNLSPTYEFIFHFVKNLNYKYNIIKSPLSVNTKTSNPPRHRNLDSKMNSKFSPYIPDSNGKNIGDYWTDDIIMTSVANQKNSIIEHPAPFPKEIVILPLLQTTEEDDFVLDPFCGLSTTGKVSLKYRRKFIGYDVNEIFIKSSIESLII